MSRREREREMNESYLLPDTMECLRITSCDSLRSSANTNFQATLRLLPLNVFPTLYDAVRQKKVIKKNNEKTNDVRFTVTHDGICTVLHSIDVRIDI